MWPLAPFQGLTYTHTHSPTHTRARAGRGRPRVHKTGLPGRVPEKELCAAGPIPRSSCSGNGRESQEPGLPGPGALRPVLRLQEARWRERPARGWEKPELLQRGVPGCSELSPPPLHAPAAAPSLRQCGSLVAGILQAPPRPGCREGEHRPRIRFEGVTCLGCVGERCPGSLG